jgi:hypothetical protein
MCSPPGAVVAPALAAVLVEVAASSALCPPSFRLEVAASVDWACWWHAWGWFRRLLLGSFGSQRSSSSRGACGPHVGPMHKRWFELHTFLVKQACSPRC